MPKVDFLKKSRSENQETQKQLSGGIERGNDAPQAHQWGRSRGKGEMARQRRATQGDKESARRRRAEKMGAWCVPRARLTAENQYSPYCFNCMDIWFLVFCPFHFLVCSCPCIFVCENTFLHFCNFRFLCKPKVKC